MLFQVIIYFSNEYLIIYMYVYRFNTQEKSSKPVLMFRSDPTDLYRVHGFRFNPKSVVIVEIEYSMNCQFTLYIQFACIYVYSVLWHFSFNCCQSHASRMAKHFNSIRRANSDNKGKRIQIRWQYYAYYNIAPPIQSVPSFLQSKSEWFSGAYRH